MFRKFSYHCVNSKSSCIRWVCSKNKRGKCKAYLKAHSETPDVPTEIFDVHNHEPPIYHITKEGDYIKV
ncbi:hypothetical protein JYU34_004351 [Plutella xylostella]|uniref:FLYWCH-type domain-containing protein n=1 Tax=Plutella xylostella TaxID=51655 RepID=A0ABQ7QXS8_PLUXY|nr:hypothetical protein JYU34_004351 [Plutella xylostella]